MTEESSSTPEGTETASPEPEKHEAPAPKPSETVDFWKQKAREQEARAKANAEAAARLKEFEDRDKSDAQKLSERAETAEARATKAELALARLEVALDKKLTPSQAKRLVGTTREEFEADADELLRDIGDLNAPRTPQPDPIQGRTPTATPLSPRAADIAQIEADMAAAKRR